MHSRYLCLIPVLAALLLFTTAPVSAAHEGGHSGHSGHAPAKAGEGSVYTVKGKIIQVEKGADKVVIDHEPVPALKWPQMTMPFSVEIPSLLDGLKKGDSVRFDFRPMGQGKDPVIMDIEVLK